MNKERIKGIIALAIPTIVLVSVMIAELGLKETILTSFIASFFIVTPPFLIMDVIIDNLKEDYNDLD